MKFRIWKEHEVWAVVAPRSNLIFYYPKFEYCIKFMDDLIKVNKGLIFYDFRRT